MHLRNIHTNICLRQLNDNLGYLNKYKRHSNIYGKMYITNKLNISV